VKLEDSFEVPVSPEQAWELLMDVPRVIPCMPGAQLTETVDDGHWKATMSVRLGPIGLQFATDFVRESADVAARRAKLSANARETRGRGGGRATIESSLTPLNGATRVDIVTDMTLSGPVAQYGRGMIVDVSRQLTAQFADCLRAQLAATTPAEAETIAAEQGRPVAGLRLGFAAFRRASVRPLQRGYRFVADAIAGGYDWLAGLSGRVSAALMIAALLGLPVVVGISTDRFLYLTANFFGVLLLLFSVGIYRRRTG
jgi:carbon monoxide dehydrogenase subunit G